MTLLANVREIAIMSDGSVLVLVPKRLDRMLHCSDVALRPEAQARLNHHAAATRSP